MYYEEVIKRQTLSNDSECITCVCPETRNVSFIIIVVARLLVGVAKTCPLTHLMTGDATNTLYNDDTGILMIIRYNILEITGKITEIDYSDMVRGWGCCQHLIIHISPHSNHFSHITNHTPNHLRCNLIGWLVLLTS